MSANTQPIRGPKLRNSCDACNLAKVKCSKARPSCARCQSHEVQCIYGISMRSGKHPANRNNIRKPSPESPKSASALQRGVALGDRPFFLSEERNPLFEQSLSSMVEPTSTTDEWTSLSHDETGLGSLGDFMNYNEPAKVHQNYPQSYGQNLFPALQPHLIWDDNQTIPQDMFSTDPHTLPAPLKTPITPKTPSATLSGTPQTPPSMASLTSCFCQQKILQQLFELSKSPGVSPSFDVALNQNKEVVAFCHSILDERTCSQHDASDVLIFAALIAKIISIYECIYPKCNQGLPSPRSSSHSGSNTWSGDDTPSAFAPEMDDSESVCSSANPSNPGSHWNTPYPSTVSLSSMASGRTATVPVRLTLGAYQLDQKDEEKLKMEILKIELSKVSDLIRAFGQRYTSNGAQSRFQSMIDEDMVIYLEKRLRDSLEMLKGQHR